MEERVELIILGSGTGSPNPERSPSSILLRTEGALLLFDFGPGTMNRLLQEGFTPDRIDAILLSHFHMDHTLDLWAYYFAARDGSFTRPDPAVLIASPMFTDLHLAITRAYGKHAEPPPELDRLIPANPGPIDLAQGGSNLAGLRIIAGPVAHKPESLAFRIEVEDRSLVYSGDTDYSPELVSLARGVDWLILEATRPDHQKLKGHLTPTLAGQMAREAGAGNLILTHLSPHHGDIDPAPSARKEFPGRVIAALDGMRIVI